MREVKPKYEPSVRGTRDGAAREPGGRPAAAPGAAPSAAKLSGAPKEGEAESSHRRGDRRAGDGGGGLRKAEALLPVGKRERQLEGRGKPRMIWESWLDTVDNVAGL